MKLLLLSLFALSTVGIGTTVALKHTTGFQEVEQEQTAPLMRAKLAGSQNVLDGLVSENFELIRHGAENMKRMSEAVNWPRADDQVYQHMGQEFRRQCDKLMELADTGDLDGAHYTFLQMTSSCINCHNYVRRAFRVERDAGNPQGPIRLIPTEWEGRTYKKDQSDR
ncbi:MAG: hypothetical protein ACR2NP_10710 [Pirellulaceae bacterium]